MNIKNFLPYNSLFLKTLEHGDSGKGENACQGYNLFFPVFATHSVTSSKIRAIILSRVPCSINKCALNFLLFLIACFTEDQQIWHHTLV